MCCNTPWSWFKHHQGCRKKQRTQHKCFQGINSAAAAATAAGMCSKTLAQPFFCFFLSTPQTLLFPCFSSKSSSSSPVSPALWAEDVIDSYDPCGLHLFSLRRRVCAQAVETSQKWLVGVVVWCVGRERSGRRRTTTSEAEKVRHVRKKLVHHPRTKAPTRVHLGLKPVLIPCRTRRGKRGRRER